MTREDIIRMALQAGAKPSSNPEKWDIFEISDTSLERFADLVAAHWVGLTNEEIKEVIDTHTIDDQGFEIWCDGPKVIRAVQDKLKEKNT